MGVKIGENTLLAGNTVLKSGEQVNVSRAAAGDSKAPLSMAVTSAISSPPYDPAWLNDPKGIVNVAMVQAMIEAGSGDGAESEKVVTASGTTGAYPAIALTAGWWEISFQFVRDANDFMSAAPDLSKLLSTYYHSALDENGTLGKMILIGGSAKLRDSGGYTNFATAIVYDNGSTGGSTVYWFDANNVTRGPSEAPLNASHLSLTVMINVEDGNDILSNQHEGQNYRNWSIVARKMS